MSSKVKTCIILILLCVIIAVVPLAFIKDSEFGGSDDEASNAISSTHQYRKHPADARHNHGLT